jgi:DNA modification methylase
MTYTDEQILNLLGSKTYDEVSRETGYSRGRIYGIALKNGARKTEKRILERAAERKKRQAETLEAIIGTTAKADVLDYLDSLPSESVSLFLTSPPYNVGKTYGSGNGDAMRFTYYLGWMMQIISEASRVLKEGGVLALQIGSTRLDDGMIMPLDLLVNDAVMKTGLTYQNRIVWHIPHGLTPKKRLAGRHETVLIYSKGEPACFNADSARVPQKEPGKRAFKGPNKGKLSGHPFGAWPGDVWSIPSIGANNGEKTGHPAQMPEELARRVIQLYTKPGDLVVDPFSGSGTTHVTCVRTGRAFSGCDLFYEDLRSERLKEAGLENFCILPGVTRESTAIWQAEARRVDHQPEQLDMLSAA